MRYWIPMFFLLLVPLAACANPIAADPEGISSDWILIFGALAVESAVAVAVVRFVGVRPFRFFVLAYAANCAVFLFVFLPLMSIEQPPAMAESIVVAIDAVALKMIGKVPALQGPRFGALSWWVVLIASVLGNAASFGIGWLLMPDG